MSAATTTENTKADSITVEKVGVIFCTKNSADTIQNAIAAVKDNGYNIEAVIVIDGFSSDRTMDAAKQAGATNVITQPERKFPGKGIAMKAGIEEAKKTGTNIALFLDSDIKNLSGKWIDALIEPIVHSGYDMTRGFYERQPRDAAVTKLIAKPMLSTFFPELSHFEQPLSGEVCARMQVWQDLVDKEKKGNARKPPDGWGIDVWFLIEAMMSGNKIKEVFLGRKEHTSFDGYREDVGKLHKMSEQVLFTILNEAVKHNRFGQHYNKPSL